MAEIFLKPENIIQLILTENIKEKILGTKKLHLIRNGNSPKCVEFRGKMDLCSITHSDVKKALKIFRVSYTNKMLF